MDGCIYRIRQFESEIAKVRIYYVDYHRNLLQHLKDFYENRVVTVNEDGLDEQRVSNALRTPSGCQTFVAHATKSNS